MANPYGGGFIDSLAALGNGFVQGFQMGQQAKQQRLAQQEHAQDRTEQKRIDKEERYHQDLDRETKWVNSAGSLDDKKSRAQAANQRLFDAYPEFHHVGYHNEGVAGGEGPLAGKLQQPVPEQQPTQPFSVPIAQPGQQSPFVFTPPPTGIGFVDAAMKQDVPTVTGTAVSNGAVPANVYGNEGIGGIGSIADLVKLQNAGQTAPASFGAITPVTPGNIDLAKRPIVHNPDGSYSTVKSLTFTNDDGSAVLVPSVVDMGDGNGARVVSAKEALQHYKQTGEHLGIFRNEDEANRYAETLHEDQANMYDAQAEGQQKPSGLIGFMLGQTAAPQIKKVADQGSWTPDMLIDDSVSSKDMSTKTSIWQDMRKYEMDGSQYADLYNWYIDKTKGIDDLPKSLMGVGGLTAKDRASYGLRKDNALRQAKKDLIAARTRMTPEAAAQSVLQSFTDAGSPVTLDQLTQMARNIDPMTAAQRLQAYQNDISKQLMIAMQSVDTAKQKLAEWRKEDQENDSLGIPREHESDINLLENMMNQAFGDWSKQVTNGAQSVVAQPSGGSGIVKPAVLTNNGNGTVQATVTETPVPPLPVLNPLGVNKVAAGMGNGGLSARGAAAAKKNSLDNEGQALRNEGSKLENELKRKKLAEGGGSNTKPVLDGSVGSLKYKAPQTYKEIKGYRISDKVPIAEAESNIAYMKQVGDLVPDKKTKVWKFKSHVISAGPRKGQTWDPMKERVAVLNNKYDKPSGGSAKSADMGDGAVTYFKNRLMKIKGQLPKKNQIDKIDMKALLKDLGLKYNPEAARRALHKLVG